MWNQPPLEIHCYDNVNILSLELRNSLVTFNLFLLLLLLLLFIFIFKYLHLFMGDLFYIGFRTPLQIILWALTLDCDE